MRILGLCPIFELLVGYITYNILNMILEQYATIFNEERKRQNLFNQTNIIQKHTPCQGIFERSMRLPCHREMADYKAAEIPIPLEVIHRHWLLAADIPSHNEDGVPPQMIPDPDS